ncbi:MAG TPA: cellulase family glycosylhydrolase [Conexibacter sp.]|nr:cellulase family glycosylhydrolase [Conexibacter sp.]
MRYRILLVVVTLTALLLLPAAAANASSHEFTMVEAPTELLFSGSPDAGLDTIKDLGATAVRIQMNWNLVAPDADSTHAPSFNQTDPNAYPAANWARYDAAIDGARARGLRVYLTITGAAPKWATPKHDGLTSPSASAFGKFATAVGRRYGSKISWWSIWNEPNLGKLLKPIYKGGRGRTLASPAIYRQLYLQAYSGLRSAHVTAPVLIGELAPRANSQRVNGTVAPLAFLRAVLCLDGRYHKARSCARVPTQGVAIHPYTTQFGPFFRPANPDDVTIGVISRLVSAVDRAAQAGALPGHLPIYISEFGVQSWPDRDVGVPLPAQSDYRSIGEHMAWSNSRVASFSQYLLRDDVSAGGATGRFQSGLFLDAGGTAKPAYFGFRLPLVVSKGRHGRVALWGFVRPTHGRAGTLTIQIEDRGHGWRQLATQRYGAGGYWKRGASYKAGRRWRVVWTDPATGKVWDGPATAAYSQR